MLGQLYAGITDCYSNLQIKNIPKAYLPKDRAATKAVVILLAHRTAACSSSMPPLEIAPKQIAATAARNPTTVAWTCRNRREHSSVRPQLQYDSGFNIDRSRNFRE